MTDSVNGGRKVAITGMGIVSCIGNHVDEVEDSLKRGKSGIVLDPSRLERGFRSGLTGKIRGFDIGEKGLKRKALRTMGQPARYGCWAALDAVEDSGLAGEVIQSPRCGVVFSNDSTVRAGVTAVDTAREHGKNRFIQSGSIFKTMNSTVTMNLAALLGVKGANWTLSAACAGGVHAVGQALMLIRSGLQDVVIAGGAQETNWMGMASFDALGALSIRHGDPEGASRPFDAGRDGLVPSGGGACLVLEDLAHARARGARIHGVVEGYGFSSDAGGNLSRPSVEGAVTAMEAALGDAGVSPSEIDYINAHATSTPTGDVVEARAISRVFGPDKPVSATKSMTGHECWMAGISEVIYTALMARGNFIAPTINYAAMEEEGPHIHIVGETREAAVGRALSNSFGFGGTNGAVVLDFDSGREG